MEKVTVKEIPLPDAIQARIRHFQSALKVEEAKVQGVIQGLVEAQVLHIGLQEARWSVSPDGTKILIEKEGQ